MNTNDLSKFGLREIKIASVLLQKYSDGEVTDRCRDYFGYSGVKLEFNTNSGIVYLVDDDCNVAIVNDDLDLLDLFLFTPDDGFEGFFDELVDNYNEMSEDDREYLKSYDTEHVIEDREEQNEPQERINKQ